MENGTISMGLNLSGLFKPQLITRNVDGSMYMFDNDAVLYKISPDGSSSSKRINSTDSLLNRAIGLHKQFENGFQGYPTAMAPHKDASLLVFRYNSASSVLYKIFTDKSFVRLYQFDHTSNYIGADGVNRQAQVAEPSKMIVRSNGDIYIIDGPTIRKMGFEYSSSMYAWCGGVRSCSCMLIVWGYLNNWPKQYDYRTSISVWIFVASDVGALIITPFTASRQ